MIHLIASDIKMCLDIIDNNYFRNHKYASIYTGFVIINASIYFLKLFDLITLTKPYSIIFEVSYGILLLTFLLNYFLFTRIGKLELVANKFIILQNDIPETLLTESVKTIKIKHSSGHHYYLKFNTGFNVLVDMKNDQLNQFKLFCKNHNIEVEASNFSRRLRTIFKQNQS
ncbi:hypothetical protein HNV08_10990 [Winogradskyella eckloniae]|uniref:hypothetical protein n=1 Tax=Winogradskyella eckloniae TaxID=1089306 RepID=UPI001563559A|nr:hypothetical protein [Winogradskyella eckloniae]NRD20574.1 hypothetical protein [Winogradskyella eckloniae]